MISIILNLIILDETFAWLVVVILPINSAINPLLYTFTTPKYRDRFFSRNLYRMIWTMRTEATTASSNPGLNNLESLINIKFIMYFYYIADDSLLGKMIPLIYTKGLAQNWKI